MKYEYLFDYPNKLQILFDKLDKNGIKAIIVGGYIRDKFLNLDSKDIDIELFGVNSFEELEKILQEFGNVNSVGKSFGVCKLSLDDLDLDFTLPRSDNKIKPGHTGFEIKIDKNLDFKTASSRRDFTINAIGFSTQEQKILDPFYGQEDIKNKILRAVDINKFAEDPLRVLRLVGFASRFSFTIENNLFNLCKQMCDENILNELPQERIYTELKKILLKSSKPSHGFLLLKELNALQYFKPLDTLNENDFNDIINALDAFVLYKVNDNKTNISLMLSILCYKFTITQTSDFIKNLTNDKSLLDKVLSILENDFQTKYTDSDLYRLATKVNLEHFFIFSKAMNRDIDTSIFENINSRANNLGILNKKAEAYLKGKDILELGLSPSQEFSKILTIAYEKQMNLEINSRNEALEWLKDYLKSEKA